MKFLLLFILVCSCQSRNENEIWIYTSLYKDTIADITPRLEKAFPGMKINWYQAGSEEIAAKVNTELIAGVPKADILISSERFWYQELSDSGRLHSWKPSRYEDFRKEYQYPQGNYRHTGQVRKIDSDAMKAEDAPKSFRELANPKYRGLATGGSPLASGTAFTTVLALYEKYGWDYFHELRKNNFLFDGGNSAVLKRIQTKERPVGFVLLENILRFQHDDPRLKVIYPDDFVVTQFNTMGIPKKENMRPVVMKIAEWFFTNDGQEAMTRSFMHSPLKNFRPPEGARDLSILNEKSFAWTESLIHELTEKRFEIKENYVEIMFK